MSDIDLLDRRLSDVESLIRRLQVDRTTGKVTLSNVLTFRPKVSSKNTDTPIDPAIESDTIKAIEEKNRKNKERIARERQKSNKEVLKDYRIKD